MNRIDARKIAESGITVGQIKAMLKRAYEAGAANTSISTVNKGITKAVGYNIFVGAYQEQADADVIRGTGEIMCAVNAIREFGEFGDWNLEEVLHPLNMDTPIHHEEPIDCPF